MRFSIQPCEVTDARDMATVTMTAWDTDWHWIHRWEGYSVGDLIEQSTKRVPWNLVSGRETQRVQKAVDVTTGEVVGHARWLLPPEPAEKNIWPEAQVNEPSPEDRELFEKISQETPLGKVKSEAMIEYRGRGLADAARRVKGNESYLSKCSIRFTDKKLIGIHLVVEFLVVKPAFQRQGVASLLVKSGCEVADAYNLKVFVIASPAGKKVYEGQGFRLVETVSTDYSQFGASEPYVHHFLVRQPVSVKAQADGGRV